MDKELQFKSAKIESKEEKEDGSLHITFYGAAFDNVDSWGDVIVPGAFDNFLKGEDRKRIHLCYQHDRSEVIGMITDIKTDAIGLLCEADVLPTSKGKDVQLLLKSGAVNEFSIGYYADEYHFEKREGYQGSIRVLDAVTVVEVSPVTRAANPKAVLLDAKSEDFRKGLKEMTYDELDALKTAINEEIIARI